MLLRVITQRFNSINAHLSLSQYNLPLLTRLSSQPVRDEGELKIENILKDNLKVHEIDVRDISGGCGSMYEIFVSSTDFKGKRMVQQHRMVTEILKKEVQEMHGLRIQTGIPEENT